jgi:hypothetical protein
MPWDILDAVCLAEIDMPRTTAGVSGRLTTKSPP